MPCRCARSRISVIALAIADGRSNVADVELHAAGLDLRQVEDVVDELKQVPAGRVDVLEVVVLLFVQLAEQPLEQHLGKADDRVERRAQLVRHVGEELGLVLVGDLELPALVLDLAEQAHVLDRDHRLVGEGLQQRDVLVARTGRTSSRHTTIDPDRPCPRGASARPASLR